MNDKLFNMLFITGKELSYIEQAILENRHTAGDGPFTKKCQTWLEEQLGSVKVLLTHSCTAALEMAAILADINRGDEIIMPSYTFVSTANAFVLRGGVPVFVDIRPDTLNINERLIEAAITARTRAIVPVHYAGVACAMDSIMDIARRHNLLVIEDAAQGIMSTYQGRPLGTIGNFGALSFHETKNIISGEGGALAINDALFAERAEIVRDKGTDRSQFLRGKVDRYTWMDVGSSYLLSDILAAFLYAQMEKAEQISNRRSLLYDLYMQNLQSLSAKGVLQLPGVPPDCSSKGHIFYMVTRSLQERKDLAAFLNQYGITAVFHYVPLHGSPAGKQYGRTCGTMEITERISDCLLRLPLYYEMTQEDVCFVVEKIKNFYELI
jgi:dTDP-4-amino-4,6-dideoxygalactose transaminase